MSDHYHYALDYTLRRDTPEALITALTALTGGQPVPEVALKALPGMVAEYLRSGDFVGTLGPDRPITRISRLGTPYREETPGDPMWMFHYERVFHDDEFWNGGMYLIYWLFQFAAEQGHLAVMRLVFDTPPQIFTLIDGDIVTTDLTYNPETHQPLAFRDSPPDRDEPLVIGTRRRQNLAQLLQDIAFMAESD